MARPQTGGRALAQCERSARYVPLAPPGARPRWALRRYHPSTAHTTSPQCVLDFRPADAQIRDSHTCPSFGWFGLKKFVLQTCSHCAPRFKREIGCRLPLGRPRAQGGNADACSHRSLPGTCHTQAPHVLGCKWKRREDAAHVFNQWTTLTSRESWGRPSDGPQPRRQTIRGGPRAVPSRGHGCRQRRTLGWPSQSRAERRHVEALGSRRTNLRHLPFLQRLQTEARP